MCRGSLFILRPRGNCETNLSGHTDNLSATYPHSQQHTYNPYSISIYLHLHPPVVFDQLWLPTAENSSQPFKITSRRESMVCLFFIENFQHSQPSVVIEPPSWFDNHRKWCVLPKSVTLCLLPVAFRLLDVTYFIRLTYIVKLIRLFANFNCYRKLKIHHGLHPWWCLTALASASIYKLACGGIFLKLFPPLSSFTYLLSTALAIPTCQ